ncbi:MAG: hypothetical protein PVF65_04480 [Sphingomonadales bacterium]|jgi:hypothetical protein
MKNFILIVIALVFLLIVGGALYLLAADIPAPTQRIEHTIDDSRFPD